DSYRNWLPYKLGSGGKDYTSIAEFVLTRRAGAGGAATDFSAMPTNDPTASYRIVSDGPVFTEVETISYSQISATYPEFSSQFLRFTTRTKVFQNGMIKTENVMAVDKA
ncbi:hypothetical protein, partial [Klebsiella michiganensis]|uniref:hypothetical protein n=1 Tax=Klebsiella michiganensis TaxID=1134687 RepID=UPI002595146C